MIGFSQFIKESEQWEKWITGLKKGSSTCYLFDGPRESGHVYRDHKGNLVWETDKYDRGFHSDKEAFDWLKANKMKYVGVDSIDDDDYDEDDYQRD